MPPTMQFEPIILASHKWSATPHVPLYLFFGGLTAGLLIVAALAEFAGWKFPRFDPLARVAAYLAIPCAGLGGFFISAHLGKPERGILFPFFFTNYSSWMTWGGWILGSVSLIAIAYGALWYFRAGKGARTVVALLGLVIAPLLAMYTGWLLSGFGTIHGFTPLWSHKYLPIMFLNSGVTTGVACASLGLLVARYLSMRWPWVGVSLPSQELSNVLRWTTVVLAGAILLEAYELYSFLTHLATGSPEKGGPYVYHILTKGDLAPWFWWGFVVPGLAIPLILGLVGIFAQARKPIPALAGAYFSLALIGGLVLRFLIVTGGDMVKQPLPFPPWGAVYGIGAEGGPGAKK
ncbi:MAG: NrfD/PsrC family molybdoenzyme membrane anchor subunit [Candidatus Methylomirabilales bacterium]